MKHHIFDYEALGQNVFKCPALTVSYYTFEFDRFSSVMEPYYFKELIAEIETTKFSVEDQVKNYGYKIEKETLQWWKDKPSPARDILIPTAQDRTLKDGLEEHFEYIDQKKKVSRWWSRSNTFDPILLQRFVNDTNMNKTMTQHLKYWDVRDIRTYVDSKFQFTTKTDFCPFPDERKWNSVYIPHIASHDIAADIMRMQAIIRAENDLDEIND